MLLALDNLTWPLSHQTSHLSKEWKYSKLKNGGAIYEFSFWSRPLKFYMGHLKLPILVAEVILLHFRVTSSCVMVLSLPWFWVQILEPELTLHLALQFVMRMSRKNPCCNLCGYIFHHRLWGLLWYNTSLFKCNRNVYRSQHCGRWNHPT